MGTIGELSLIRSYGLQLENFSAAVRGLARPALGEDDALGNARVLAALRESAAERRWVSL
ncbi:MAG TPA: hypothetical protein VEH52_11775 [Gaiellaceae bacterium]|nr:hypothetical protein [Gaiellaceae bacterium]